MIQFVHRCVFLDFTYAWESSRNFFDVLEDQCFELDKKIQMQLSIQNSQLSESDSDEKILALRAAQQHSNQARQFREKSKLITGITKFAKFAFSSNYHACLNHCTTN